MAIQICIVEDDESIARMIEAALSIVGYECEIYGDGVQATEQILKYNYDLILLDIMLPGIDGFEVLQRIRSREIPVIFLTAMQAVSDKVKGLKLGAEDYIVKPFEAVELLAESKWFFGVITKRRHCLPMRIWKSISKSIASPKAGYRSC